MKTPASSATATALVLALFALLISTAASQEERSEDRPKPLSRELATRLISDFYEIGKNEVKLAYIIDGKNKKDGFESSVGAEATFIRPVVVEGRRSRQVFSLRFHYDKKLGWFLQTIIEKDGRTFIDICSEHLGRIRIE